jgi:hypothetical protein
MKRKKTEALVGVTPLELDSCRTYFVVHKSAKKDKTSFQITRALLDNLMETQFQIGKKPKLIIDIQIPGYVYILTCDVTKNKVS